MNARVLVPALFVLAGALGWLLLWNTPGDPRERRSKVPEPEPQLIAPTVRAAPPVKPVARPEPTAPARKKPPRVRDLAVEPSEQDEAKARQYYRDLMNHQLAMLAQARKQAEALERSDDEDDLQRARDLKREVEGAEAELQRLKDYMAALPD
ncbi:MAG: hypothetical protein OXU20_14380 [Myxococcales bacterium]|nr:hypothetical protein [Myxococcales bacterium]MDD9971336.1 hypothetical protein [Myxococcales bacterium]